jgi:type IX secretion system PorP/SprF family membrane protein
MILCAVCFGKTLRQTAFFVSFCRKKLHTWLLVALILLTFFGWHSCAAQQLPFHNQYHQNFSLINPAAVGISAHRQLSTGYRQQWVGWQGAPRSGYAMLEMPLALLKDKEEEVESNFHSGGISAVSDHAGLFSRNGLYAHYAYHLTLSQRNLYDEKTRLQLSMGASMGILSIGFRSQDAILLNPNDNALANQQTAWSPDLNMGVWLHDDRFFVGGSLFQVVESRLNIAQDTRLRRHYGLMGGYHFEVSPQVRLTPSFFVQTAFTAPFWADFNLTATLLDKFYCGASYRHERAAQAFLGAQPNAKWRVYYHYDFATSAQHQVYRQSHEIALFLFL